MTHASPEEQVWQLFFDSVSRTGSRGSIVAGMGVVLIFPQNYMIPHAFQSSESCSNNVAEYNAIEMQLAEEIGVKHFEAYGDSKLIVNQVRGEYEVDMKIWCPTTTQPSTSLRSSEAFTSTMYHANRMHMQMHWRPSPLHWLFQPERRRKYLSTIVTCTAQNSPLKAIRLKK